jgi:alpha-N-arabinofuranosidase
MASYAPLFANTEAWQWTPDLIWVDSLQVLRTPNYYVQQMFSRNRGDVVLPTQIEGIQKSASGVEALYASATRDDQAGEIILKVVNPGDNVQTADINLNGANVSPSATKIVLAGNLEAVNSMEVPQNISPVESKLEHIAAKFSCEFAPHSMTVLRIKLK